MGILLDINIWWLSHKWGDPKMDVLDNIGTSHVFMDDDWGYHDETEARYLQIMIFVAI